MIGGGFWWAVLFDGAAIAGLVVGVIWSQTASKARSMTDEPAAPAFENLCVDYRVKSKSLRVLHDVSLRIGRGEVFGLVGESGCGKSTAAFAALRYLPRNGAVSGGLILMDGQDIERL